MKVICLFVLVFFIAATEFLATIESKIQFNITNYSIISETMGNITLVASTNDYKSFIVKLSPDGQILIYSFQSFNPTANQLTSQSNPSISLIPGMYGGFTSILKHSISSDYIMIIQFKQYKLIPLDIAQISQSDEYLLVTNNLLIRFTLISEEYKVFEFQSFHPGYILSMTNKNFIVSGKLYSDSYYNRQSQKTELLNQILLYTDSFFFLLIAHLLKILRLVFIIQSQFLLSYSIFSPKQFPSIRLTSSGYKEFAYTLTPYGDTFNVRAMSKTKRSQIIATGSYNQKLFVMCISDQGAVVYARLVSTSFSMIGLTIKQIESGIIITGYTSHNKFREVFALELDKNGMTNNQSYPVVNITTHASALSLEIQLVSRSYYWQLNNYTLQNAVEVTIMPTQQDFGVISTLLFLTPHSNTYQFVKVDSLKNNHISISTLQIISIIMIFAVQLFHRIMSEKTKVFQSCKWFKGCKDMICSRKGEQKKKKRNYLQFDSDRN